MGGGQASKIEKWEVKLTFFNLNSGKKPYKFAEVFFFFFF